jgi:hypothetical protein
MTRKVDGPAYFKNFANIKRFLSILIDFPSHGKIQDYYASGNDRLWPLAAVKSIV